MLIIYRTLSSLCLKRPVIEFGTGAISHKAILLGSSKVLLSHQSFNDRQNAECCKGNESLKIIACIMKELSKLHQLVYWNVVAVCSVTICSIRQHFITRHLHFWINYIVGWVTHCPSPTKWRHITVRPEHLEPAIRLYAVHTITSMRVYSLNVLAVKVNI